MGFTRKVIRSSRKRAIRSLAQRRVRRMKGDALVGDFIRRAHRSRAGVVIIELPEDKTAVGSRSAAYVNYTGRTKICPGKFLFPRPDQLYRFSGGLRQARRFDCGFARVLASIRRAGIGHNHAHAFWSQMEGLRKFFGDGEWTLSSRPHRQLAIFPFGDSGPRLERSVRDVCDGVSLPQRLLGLSAGLLNRSQNVLLSVVVLIRRRFS